MQRLVRPLLLASVAFCTPAAAQFNGCAPGICNTNPQTTNFPLPGIVPNGLDCYLSRGLYYPSQAGCTLTVVRASAGTAVDSNGNWSQFANNVLRLTNLGATIEEGRTNGIRNNTMQGAVVGVIGSGGALPTNWTINLGAGGLTATVVALGSQNGTNTIRINVAGTPTATGNFNLEVDGNTNIPAVYGQTLSLSHLLAIVGGSTTNISSIVESINERNSGGSGVQAQNGSNITLTPSLTRYAFSATIGGSTTAFARPDLVFGTTINLPINIDFLVAWTQLENNSLINSTVASAVVASGGTCTPGTYTFTLSGGTGTQGTISGTVTGTALSGALIVVTPGSYTVLPPSPATLTGGTCTVQPTVTLTPTNNAAMGFATTPILTTNAAVARAADVISESVTGVGVASTVYGAASHISPVGFSEQVVNLNNGTATDSIAVLRNVAGAGQAAVSAASVSQYNQTTGTWSQNAIGKAAVAAVAGAQNAAFDGSAMTPGSGASQPTGVNTVRIGANAAGTAAFCNCVLSRFAIWPTTAQPSAVLQSITNLNQYNYLLRRDLGGPAYDNRPMWLREAA